MNKLFLGLLAIAALVSCQNRNDYKLVNYSDSVVTLSQVDPAYQAYFREQNGANYGVEEQRAALAAAAKTAASPVPTSMAVSNSRLATRKTSAASARRGVAAAKKPAAKGTSARKGVAAAKKPAAKGKAVAAAKKPVAKKSTAVAAKGKSGKATRKRG